MDQETRFRQVKFKGTSGLGVCLWRGKSYDKLVNLRDGGSIFHCVTSANFEFYIPFLLDIQKLHKWRWGCNKL